MGSKAIYQLTWTLSWVSFPRRYFSSISSLPGVTHFVGICLLMVRASFCAGVFAALTVPVAIENEAEMQQELLLIDRGCW